MKTLKFASETEALQHLANMSRKRVKVAGEKQSYKSVVEKLHSSGVDYHDIVIAACKKVGWTHYVASDRRGIVLGTEEFVDSLILDVPELGNFSKGPTPSRADDHIAALLDVTNDDFLTQIALEAARKVGWTHAVIPPDADRGGELHGIVLGTQAFVDDIESSDDPADWWKKGVRQASEELRFASEAEALQYLADMSGKRVKVAGETPDEMLDRGFKLRDFDLIQRAVELGAKPSLYNALYTKNPKIVKFVIGTGAKPTKNSLDIALDIEEIELVKLVIDAGAKPTDDTLDYALETKNPEIIKTVIDVGAKPDEYTLTYALYTENQKIIQKVIDLGAKPDEYTLNVALESKNPEIIKMVKELLQKHNVKTASNGLMFASEAEALQYLANVSGRRMLVADQRSKDALRKLKEKFVRVVEGYRSQNSDGFERVLNRYGGYDFIIKALDAAVERDCPADTYDTAADFVRWANEELNAKWHDQGIVDVLTAEE